MIKARPAGFEPATVGLEVERRFLLRDRTDLRMAFRCLRPDKDHSEHVPDLASTLIGMGLLLVLRPPPTRPKSLRRATRAQRREHHRANAQEWEIARQRGWLLDVEVEELLPLVNSAGANRLPVLGHLDPWADTILDRRDLPLLEADVDRLEAVASNDVQHELVAAIRKLLITWHTEPNLMLHCYGD
ncbi:hypothetical protein ACIBI7_46130 [Nonomuraea fuscirosea]|uniref:hypothetical protein n=1 Tax=Nonomuraea fuscirosea TaxID=1291556 RepID=UPI00379AAA5B